MTRFSFPPWIFLIGVVTYLFLLFFIFIRTEHKGIEHMKVKAIESLEIRVAHMESELENIFRIGRIITTDERITELMSHRDYRTPQLGINHLLTRIKVTTGLVIYIMSTDGSLVASGDWDNPVPYSTNLRNIPDFLGTVLGGGYFQVVLPQIHSVDGYSYSISMPIRLDGRIAGIATFKTNLDDLIFAEELSQHILLSDYDQSSASLN